MSNQNHMDGKTRWVAFLSETGPYVILTVSFTILIASLIAFAMSDVIAGGVVGKYLSSDTTFGIFTTLATTGLTAGCFAALVFGVQKKWNPGILFTLGVIFFALQIADVYLDSLSVDIMRFGYITDLANFSTQTEAHAHLLYRALIGGISLIGEPVAMASILMFPALKNYIVKNLKENIVGMGTSYPKPFSQRPNQKPYPRPVQPSYPRPQPRPQDQPRRNEPSYHPVLGNQDDRRDNYPF